MPSIFEETFDKIVNEAKKYKFSDQEKEGIKSRLVDFMKENPETSDNKSFEKAL